MRCCKISRSSGAGTLTKKCETVVGGRCARASSHELPAIKMREEAGASFAVADNSVLHKHSYNQLLSTPHPLPHKRTAAVSR